MGIFDFLSAKKRRLLYVKVTTMDADLEQIEIEPDWTGRQLFDTVCRIIGLREIWYFGLQYTNKKGYSCWLQMDAKICKQDVPKQEDGSLAFLFLVKFYPEIIEEELIQDITKHLFFVQIKQSILSMDLYCSAEASVLLASYAVQAMKGDCDDNEELELDRLLPKSVIEQYDMSFEMWGERIKRWWGNNSGMSREDAEMEYLRVAQDLEMYGIQYYPIHNKKETDLLLGVSAQGIGIYQDTNRINPRPFFSWNEIKNISFKNKVFSMKTQDNSKIDFRAKHMSINMSILDLCIGTHNLYLRRRQQDTLEVQQMKAQAKEARERKAEEQRRLERERERRESAEMERDRYKTEVAHITERLNVLQDAKRRTEENADLIAEKARVSEAEALVLSKRASEAEAEVQRYKVSQIKAEENKMILERKVREAELLSYRLMQDAERRNRETQLYRSQILNGSVYGAPPAPNGYVLSSPNPYRSHHLLFMPSGSSEANLSDGIFGGFDYNATTVDDLAMVGGYPMIQQQRVGSASSASNLLLAPPPPPSAQSPMGGQDPLQNQSSPRRYEGAEFPTLKRELDRARKENAEKTRRFREKMSEFRQEIDQLKKEEKVSEHDRIHANNLHLGFDKYSTLRRSGAGPAKSRVKVFEGL
uniref:Moesin/ezrin/radixin homolog 1 n=1 Tax=Steinernema glaseri TaxID=37863 RepID=A0A1I7Y0A5_9BILA